MDIKNEICKEISKILEKEFSEIDKIIVKNESISRGNFSLPCFKFASEFKDKPENIATNIKEKLNTSIMLITHDISAAAHFADRMIIMKDGEIISGYPDANNHHIDSVRYATEEIWKRAGNKQKQTYQSIWG